MKLTIVKTYHVSVQTEVEVPDDDYNAGLDFDDLAEKCEGEFNVTRDDLDGASESISVLDENGKEVYFTP